MTTPIVDFVKAYSKDNNKRFHMPGHKGTGNLGIESFDITEINGADNLYFPNGIISESEKNASNIFGCDTYYSTEGSSLCIRAMLYLALTLKNNNGRQVILSTRNAHKTFISSAALLDFDIDWIIPNNENAFYSGVVCDLDVEKALSKMENKPAAVYITSPDYLGNIADIGSISKVCKKHGILLIVDNAHGAYLRMLSKSIHPMDLGADMCCDSAHKTFPVITGGAYLHVSKELLINNYMIKSALGLFGSTSPSYLILQSLDLFNSECDEFKDGILRLEKSMSQYKEKLEKAGYSLIGDEITKITIETKKYGYLGNDISNILEKENIFCEFCDNDYIVFMVSPSNQTKDIDFLVNSLLNIERKEPIKTKAPKITMCKREMSIREACMQPKEVLSIDECNGRVLADMAISCPPAVPVAICGELLDENAIKAMKYYNIDTCAVIK